MPTKPPPRPSTTTQEGRFRLKEYHEMKEDELKSLMHPAHQTMRILGLTANSSDEYVPVINCGIPTPLLYTFCKNARAIRGHSTWQVNDIYGPLIWEFMAWIKRMVQTNAIFPKEPSFSPFSLSLCWTPAEVVAYHNTAKALGIPDQLWTPSMFTIPPSIFIDIICASEKNQENNKDLYSKIMNVYPTWLSKITFGEVLMTKAYMEEKLLGWEAARAMEQIEKTVWNTDISFSDTVDMWYCMPQSELLTVAVDYVAAKMFSSGTTDDPELVDLPTDYQTLIDRYDEAFRKLSTGT